MSTFRIEKDFLGEKQIDNNCYYGIQTLRAVENFNISGTKIYQFPTLIVALAQVKKASVLANYELGLISLDFCEAITAACNEIIAGKLHEQFVVDAIQGGAGTSTNMNANEVIANRANELTGFRKGDYHNIHPNNHVNMSQSTNDVYPTAFRVALYENLNSLEDSMVNLQKAFELKAKKFASIVKLGRTQLQDAVPMTLGQEFHTYSNMLMSDIQVLKRTKFDAKKMNLGGTAIGTGINVPPEYRDLVKEKLTLVTERDFSTADDLITATQDTAVFVQISGFMKRIAVKMSKICNDLRLLSSGPRAGFNEINLPPMQPGSSIMPGKVNPVIPEVVNQVAFDIIGADVTISMASEAGQLQLNVFEPVILYKLFQSTDMLSRALNTLKTKCIDGITANPKRCEDLVLDSISIVTALSPILGYQTCSDIAKRSLVSGKSVRTIVLEEELLSKTELDELLNPLNMLKPHN